MAGPLQILGLTTAKAPLGAVVSLVLMVAALVLFTIGWRLAVHKRYVAHRWVQTAAACLNAVVVAWWMVKSFVLYVLPAIPARLDQGSYVVATVHAAVGIVAVLFGVFVVLRGNELVPRAWRFSNYRPYMRGAYAGYLAGTLTGVILYVVAYVPIMR